MLLSSSPLPKYRQVLAELRYQITSGGLRAGDRLPSRPEMQSLYGISPATAEKIFTLLWQENLVVREPGRGTFVADIQSLTSKNVIGFVMPPEGREGNKRVSQSSYWSMLLEGVQREARRQGQEILLLTNGLEPTSLEKVDGLILAEDTWIAANLLEPNAGEAEIAQTIRTLTNGLPLVWVMAPTASGIRVGGDDLQGQYLATCHLIEQGHHNIAIFTSSHPIHQARYAGYSQAMCEADITPLATWKRLEPHCRTSSEAVVNGYTVMKQWLEDGWEESGCTALLANNDYVALGVIRALRENGLQVPEDVSVIGFDGVDVCEHVTPALTTVKVPLDEIGEAATARLLQRIRNSAVPDHDTYISPSLQMGESVCPPRKLLALERSLDFEKCGVVGSGC
jgi:DNA-binding LacI/PurR family transcriptional regulator